MIHWSEPVDGDAFDVEEFPTFFPAGEVFAVSRDGKVFLEGPKLDEQSEPDKVLRIARDAMNEFFTVLTLLEPGLRKPSVECVVSIDEAGTRKTYTYAEGHVVARSKAIGFSASDASPGRATAAQEMLENAAKSQHLQAALQIFAEPEADWGRLFRVVEEIETYLQGPVYPRYCTSAERKRLKQTANNAEVAGIDARHGLGQSRPPKNPMTIQEGREFVRRILQAVLR